MQKTADSQAQQPGKGRGEADHTRHGQGRWPQQTEALLKAISVAPFVSEKIICADEQNPGGKNSHNNLIHGCSFYSLKPL